MSSRTEVVVFKNRNGQSLFGTYHLPKSSGNSLPVVVLLSPGVKMRVGPHRLYNRLTEALTKLGYPVLKFDFFGLGDSEGELGRELLSEVYNDTESGMFVNDGIDALNWLKKHKAHDQFILGGLCGGAITGILIAQNDHRVKGLISLGMTVTLAMGAKRRAKYASQGQLRSMGRGYIGKIFDYKSWIRLLTFRSDFDAIYRSIKQLLIKETNQKSMTPSDASTQANAAALSNANPLFPPAFFSMAETGRKMLMIFSGADRLYWDYEEKFAQPFASRLERNREAYEVHLIDGANHVFSFREWENEMLVNVSEWLKTHFS